MRHLRLLCGILLCTLCVLTWIDHVRIHMQQSIVFTGYMSGFLTGMCFEGHKWLSMLLYLPISLVHIAMAMCILLQFREHSPHWIVQGCLLVELLPYIGLIRAYMEDTAWFVIASKLGIAVMLIGVATLILLVTNIYASRQKS